MSDTFEINERERARRRKKNAKRKLCRLRAAECAKLPPVMGLGREEYARLFGEDADYDQYADAFIAAAKAKRRRWEFPLVPLAGASFPSVKRHRKGMALERPEKELA